jgi:uncharacterized membrane protein YqjE
MSSQTEREGLPALFTRMADHLAQLFDTKLSLLKVELKEEIDAYLRGGMMVLAGAIIVAVGFALLNIAIAFLVSDLFANSNLDQPVRYALGFIITAVIYLVAGSVTIVVAKSRLTRQGLVPKQTVAELERDKEWLRKEI